MFTLEMLKKVNVTKFGSQNKNYVTLQHAHPNNINKEKISELKDKVFISVSLGSPAFINNKWLALCQYLDKFKNASIYICDSIYAYTLQIQEDFPLSDAIKEAELAANKTVAHQKFILEYHQRNNFNFIFHSNVEKEGAYKDIYSNLALILQSNSAMKQIFRGFSEYYLSRIGLVNHTADIVNLSNKYLLSELAGFAFLSTLGYKAMIYPGHIATIAEILDLEAPYIKKIFQDFHFLTVRISRKGSKHHSNSVLMNLVGESSNAS